MTDDHLSLDELAEFDEGLLTPERAREVQEHLAGCARCRADLDSITSTRSLLGSLPPAEMPADVTARLDQALAAEAARSTIVPNLAEHRRRRFGRPTMAASAAAAVIVLAIGAIVVAHLNQPAAKTNAGAANPSAAAGFPPQPQNYIRTSTDLDYTPQRLLTEIPGLVNDAGSPVPAAEPSASTTAGSVRQTPSAATQVLTNQPVLPSLRSLFKSRTKLLQCAATLTGNPAAVPIAIDFGTWTNGAFHKAPSAFFVFRDTDPNVVQVIVTDPTCSGTHQVRIYIKVPLH